VAVAAAVSCVRVRLVIFLRAGERFPGMLALSACGVRVLPEVLGAGAVPVCGRTRLG